MIFRDASDGRTLFQLLVWNMGYRLARKHVSRAMSWHSADELEEMHWEAQNSFWRRLIETSHFDSGYHEPWAALGSSDAAEGICRAHRYKNHSYNGGWTGEIVRRRMHGWTNPRLDGAVELMERLYWKRIPPGTSDDYYKHFEERAEGG